MTLISIVIIQAPSEIQYDEFLKILTIEISIYNLKSTNAFRTDKINR